MAIIKTSATNASSKSGFTLIEVMVVLVIMSVIVGVAASYIPNYSQGFKVEQETKRLYVAMRIAAQNAVLQSQEYGMVVEPTKYRFVTFNPISSLWEESSNEALKEYDLPDTMKLQVKPKAYVKLPTDRTPAQLRPLLLFLSSGETSGFTAALSTNEREPITGSISAEGNGPIQLGAR